jgi:hypothetical protein
MENNNNEELIIRSEEFMEKNDISYNDLTDDLKDKYDSLDEALQDFEQLETDDETIIRDTILSIEAKDSGLINELEPFYVKLKEDREKTFAQKEEERLKREEEEKLMQQQSNNPPQPINNGDGDQLGDGGKTKSARPSWRFW